MPIDLDQLCQAQAFTIARQATFINSQFDELCRQKQSAIGAAPLTRHVATLSTALQMTHADVETRDAQIRELQSQLHDQRKTIEHLTGTIATLKETIRTSDRADAASKRKQAQTLADCIEHFSRIAGHQESDRD